jgi:hypothetical protein
MRTAVDIDFDFRTEAMDKKGQCIGALAVADLFAMTIGNLLHCTDDLTRGRCEVM